MGNFDDDDRHPIPELAALEALWAKKACGEALAPGESEKVWEDLRKAYDTGLIPVDPDNDALDQLVAMTPASVYFHDSDLCIMAEFIEDPEDPDSADRRHVREQACAEFVWWQALSPLAEQRLLYLTIRELLAYVRSLEPGWPGQETLQ